MKTIHVQAPGLLTTVQDLGRDGFGPLGVSPSGAADAISLRLANRLAGNPENAAALEMTLLGGTFSFPDGAVIALAGSDFGATLDGTAIELWRSVEVQPRQTLQLGVSRSGARCYLAIAGGVAVPPFLGSASTHVLSSLGGFRGRPLRKGDVLQIGSAGARFQTHYRTHYRKRSVAPKALASLSIRKLLRVTPGPQSEMFSESEQLAFYRNTYRVTEQSNRMGVRLHGTSIAADSRGEMITEGVSLGAIQVPSSGQPIILFVEQQTTGGYPKIANVISADLHSLGQLRPRDEIRFERVDMNNAQSALKEQENLLASKELILE
jgi:antagonist of KipI